MKTTGVMVLSANTAFIPDDDGEKTPKRRKKSSATSEYVAFLKEKAEKELKLKEEQNEREMKLKEEQLALEKAKFECERKEKEARAERDTAMMTLLMQLIEKSKN